MTIKKEITEKKLMISLNGKLDTTTSPELESILREVIENVCDIYFDFSNLEYISSSGLRVLLAALKKTQEKNGNVYIENANKVVLEIMKITGFDSIFIIN